MFSNSKHSSSKILASSRQSSKTRLRDKFRTSSSNSKHKTLSQFLVLIFRLEVLTIYINLLILKLAFLYKWRDFRELLMRGFLTVNSLIHACAFHHKNWGNYCEKFIIKYKIFNLNFKEFQVPSDRVILDNFQPAFLPLIQYIFVVLEFLYKNFKKVMGKQNFNVPNYPVWRYLEFYKSVKMYLKILSKFRTKKTKNLPHRLTKKIVKNSWQCFYHKNLIKPY